MWVLGCVPGTPVTEIQGDGKPGGRGSRPRAGLCSRLLRPWAPQILTYRMNPVSVVIVSPGTTKCFLESRPRLSLRGLRALGSLISIAILAPMICASAALLSVEQLPPTFRAVTNRDA